MQSQLLHSSLRNSHLRMVKGMDGELRPSALLDSGTVTGQQGKFVYSKICRTMLIMLKIGEMKPDWDVELVDGQIAISVGKDFRIELDEWCRMIEFN